MSIFPGLFSSAGIGNKSQTSETTNNANYDLTDASQGAGDGSVVGGGDVNVTINNPASQSQIDASASLAGMALGTAVNAQTLAAQSLGVVVNGQTLQAYLADSNASLLKSANDNAAKTFQSLATSQTNSLTAALDAATAAQRNSSLYASQITDSVLSQSRAAATLAANTASDAIASNNRATSGALNFADSALIAVTNAERNAFAFADDALISSTNANRAAFGFAGDALAGSLTSAGRSVATAENALDASLGFARTAQSANNNFLTDVLNGVFSLVKTASTNATSEAQATRDFAGQFVGDFYESQKSGDVQTLQQIAKVVGVGLVAFALAWGVRGSKS